MSLLLAGTVGALVINFFAPNKGLREDKEKYYGDDEACDAYRQAFRNADIDINY